jgi:hypothetical protein
MKWDRMRAFSGQVGIIHAQSGFVFVRDMGCLAMSRTAGGTPSAEIIEISPITSLRLPCRLVHQTVWRMMPDASPESSPEQCASWRASNNRHAIRPSDGSFGRLRNLAKPFKWFQNSRYAGCHELAGSELLKACLSLNYCETRV